MLRKFYLAAVAAFLITAAAVSLRAATIPLFSNSTTPTYAACEESSQTVSCINALINAINSGVAGYYASAFGPVAAQATSTEQTFASISIPTSTLVSNGQSLRARCYGTSATNASAKTIKLYFGSNVLIAPVFTTSAGNWELEILATALVPTNQILTIATNTMQVGRGTFATSVVSPVATNDLVDSLAAPIVVKCTYITDATAAELTMEDLYIEQVK
jgi:hypothetical protein